MESPDDSRAAGGIVCHVHCLPSSPSQRFACLSSQPCLRLARATKPLHLTPAAPSNETENKDLVYHYMSLAHELLLQHSTSVQRGRWTEKVPSQRCRAQNSPRTTESSRRRWRVEHQLTTTFCYIRRISSPSPCKMQKAMLKKDRPLSKSDL